MQLIALDSKQIRSAHRRVIHALGVGPHSPRIPAAEGHQLQVLLAGRQDVMPLAIAVGIGRPGRPCLVRGATPRLSFPDLVTRALMSRGDTEDELEHLILRFGLTLTPSGSRALARPIETLNTAEGPTPWPEPIDAPQQIRAQLTHRRPRSKNLTRVFDDAIPRRIRAALSHLIQQLIAAMHDHLSHPKAVCERWLEVLKRDEHPDAHRRASLLSRTPKSVNVLGGRRPTVPVAYEYDDHLLYDHRAGVLTYNTGPDAASLRHVELANGDVRNTAGFFSTAPEFRLAELVGRYPRRQRIGSRTQLPLRVAAAHDRRTPMKLAWHLHWDAQIGPALALLQTSCPAVLELARLAPKWPSAPLIGLHAMSPRRFAELLTSAPAALLLLSKEPARVMARRPLDAALEVWGINAHRWVKRWLQRIDPALLSPSLLGQLSLALRSGSETERTLKTRLTHGLVETPAALRASVDPQIARHLSNADVRLLTQIELTCPHKRGLLFETLAKLIRAANFLGIEPPLAGLRDRAKAAVSSYQASTVEEAYELCLNYVVAGFDGAVQESAILQRIGIDRVGIDPAIVARFAHRDAQLEATPLTTPAAIRGWGLDRRGGDNCLATSDNLLMQAVFGHQLFISLSGPKRRWRKGTLALAPVFDHRGPWSVVQVGGTANRRLTAPGVSAFNHYMDALIAKGVEMVSPHEADRLRDRRSRCG